MKNQWLMTLGMVSGSLLSGIAWAQSSASNNSAKNGDDQLEELVVTGSRVISNGNDSPTPVTVVTMNDLQATHASRVFESLLDVPAFGGSTGGTGSNPSGNRATSQQISALNLRGLGAVRTLVLYDGHRVPPTEIDGFVDADVIPQMLLERVDVVTGGASAVYGSDAVGGVVNFITDRKFTGVKFEVQGGISDEEDAGTHQIGIAFGSDLFGDRGHIEGSIQTMHDDGLLHRMDRPQFQGRWTVQGNGCPNGLGSANCVPFFLVADANNPQWSYGGKIGQIGATKNPLAGDTFSSNGILTPFVNGSSAGLPANASVQIGGDGIWDQESSLKPWQTINQAFGRFDYDISEHLHYYLTGYSTLDHTFNYYGNTNSQALVISAQNAFLPLAYQQQLAAAGVTTFSLSKKYGIDSPVPPSNVDFFTHSLYLNTGLEGKVGQYKWEAAFTDSYERLDSRSNYTFNNGRFFAALDAVVNPTNGQIVCQVSLTQYASLYPGCVPINLFGPSSESAAAVNYVAQHGQFVTVMPMPDFSANITGAPFSDWAGPVNMALSTEWRRQGLELDSTNPTVNYAPLSCAPLRYNCTTPTATNVGTSTYNGSVAPRPPVSMQVIEGAIEADVPVIKSLPLVQAADLNLAYRYAQYRDNGNPDITAANFTESFSANTWKVGLDWHVNDVLTLRGTRSRDIRAPNLYELYQPNSITYTNSNQDLLTGTSLTGTGVLPEVITGGNANLKPEVASTSIIGLVLKPSSDLSLAVDVYDIKVEDYITSINGATGVYQQACYAGNSFYCSLQVRPGPITDTSKANAVTAWYVVPVNIAELSTRGVDLEANYQLRLVGRPLSFRVLATYQPHVLFAQPGTVTQDYAGALGVPYTNYTGAKARASGFLRYKATDNLTLDWQSTWRDKMHQSPDPTLLEQANAGAPAITVSNLTVSYDMKMLWGGQTTVYLNVQNVFDQPSPVAASYLGQGSPGIGDGYVPGDDPIGRYYRLGARFKW